MKKTEHITVRIAPDTKRILEAEAEQNDRSLSYLVCKIINKYVEDKIREGKTA